MDENEKRKKKNKKKKKKKLHIIFTSFPQRCKLKN